MKIKTFVISLFGLFGFILNSYVTSGMATDGSSYGHGEMMGNWNGSFFGMFMMGMMTFWFLIDLLLAYIVYNDSLNYNPSNALLWAVIVFFTSILGLLLYLLFRGPQKQYVTTSPPSNTSSASNTTQFQNQNQKFCSSCGSQLDNNSKFCSTCGALVN